MTKQNTKICYYRTVEPRARATARYQRLMEDVNALPSKTGYAPAWLPVAPPSGLRKSALTIDIQQLVVQCMTVLAKHSSSDMTKVSAEGAVNMVYGDEIWGMLQAFNAEAEIAFWVKVPGEPVVLDECKSIKTFLVDMRAAPNADKRVILEETTGMVVLASNIASRDAALRDMRKAAAREDAGNWIQIKGVADNATPPHVSPSVYQDHTDDGRYVVYDSIDAYSKAHYGTDTKTIDRSSS